MPRFHDTIAALATPAGTAAIAVLRISGTESGRIARELFGQTLTPRLAHHGDYRDGSGGLVDDVLATFFLGPNSYTGEDSLEISCHGNPFIAQKILEDLLQRGCRMAEAGEFTQRAFLNGRMDLSQAEAVMDLIHARSERALVAANLLLRGALGRRMEGLIDGLLGALARVEAYIDFPDEDLPKEDRALVAEDIKSLLAGTDQLLATSHYGALLREGIKTVIIGPPNAGKSSLLNRLVGCERALVSAEPGTTRDFIEEQIVVGPHSLRLIDTAGLNPSPAPLEKLGMAKTLERATEADLCLLVFDGSRQLPKIPAEFEAAMRGKAVLLVLNKQDLGFDPTLAVEYKDFIKISISAQTGSGINELVAEITKSADRFQQLVGEDAVAINARHASALSQAKGDLMRALVNLEERGAVELLASDLRSALAQFGEISGKVDNERMLDQLFARFCIGK